VVSVSSLPYTTVTKLFKGENNHIYNIYKAIQGRELTPTTIFTKLFKGENKHILQYLQNYSGDKC
jgi:hypothetical protein